MTGAAAVPFGRIELAHEDEFRLGRLTIRPAVRQAVRDDGENEVVEPRVMQVLVALVRAEGAILSRDDLTRCCWEGRIVGDDALNRVISRLRRLADGLAERAFRVETVTKVGYRLVQSEASVDEPPDGERSGASPGPRMAQTSRRRLVGGAIAVATLAGIGGAALWSRTRGTRPPPPRVAAMMQTGLDALSQTTGEGYAAATGIFRQVTELEPGYADGWGLLGVTYAIRSHYGDPGQAAAMDARARAATDRATAIDPDNGYAHAAAGWMLPRLGHWRRQETAFREGLLDHRDNGLLLDALSMMLIGVGRMREPASLMDHAVATNPPTPNLLYHQMLCLWGAGRFDDLDRAMDQGLRLFPLHFAIWFGRFYILLYSGRLDEAIGFAENKAGRPLSIREEQIDAAVAVARALAGGDRAQQDRILAQHVALAHIASGFAENAMQYACAFGRLDVAFAVAEAYFFGRGFVVPSIRFPQSVGSHSRRADRRAFYLFMPSTAPMRGDARFGGITEELGLERYWRETGTRPDYRVGARG